MIRGPINELSFFPLVYGFYAAFNQKSGAAKDSMRIGDGTTTTRARVFRSFGERFRGRHSAASCWLGGDWWVFCSDVVEFGAHKFVDLTKLNTKLMFPVFESGDFAAVPDGTAVLTIMNHHE